MTGAIVAPEPLVERDRYGRPLITPPGGGKPVPYTRATTVAETLDDRYNLELWKMRQVAAGLAARPDLVALAAAKADSKADLNRVCTDALAAAAAGAAANLGTALHGFVEQINRGQDPANVPAALRADLDAYRQVMGGFEVLHAEAFMVLDDLLIAGTPDIVVRERSTGRVFIADEKTGAGAVTYGQTSIAAQLAIYSRGVLYRASDGTRTQLDVDQDTAIVVHMPAGTGQCVLYDVDIAQGWEAVQHALWTRDWRKRKGLFQMREAAQATPLDAVRATPLLVDRADELRRRKIKDQVEFIGDTSLLVAHYRAAVEAGDADDELIALCAARKREIEAAQTPEALAASRAEYTARCIAGARTVEELTELYRSVRATRGEGEVEPLLPLFAARKQQLTQ